MENNQDEEALKDRCTKVHFPAEQTNAHDSQIIVEELKQCKNCYNVHLGFLQLHHEYKIEFSFNHSLGKDISFDPLQSLYLQLVNAIPTEKGHELHLTLKAEKEKLMTEELVMTSSQNPNLQVKLILHARVLGKGKGTPALKCGIHLLKVHHDEDSHTSDWNGFEN